MSGEILKKIIYISVVALVIGLGYGIYSYFSTSSPSAVTPNGAEGSSFPVSPGLSGPGRAGSNRASQTPSTSSGSGVISQTDKDIVQESSDSASTTSIRRNTTSSPRIITKDVVSGYVFVDKPSTPQDKSKQTFIRYMERGTGNVKEIDLRGKVPYRISNTTIPGIINSFWNFDGSKIIFRKLSEDNKIQNYYAFVNYSQSTSTGETIIGNLEISVLADNITQIAISPNKESAYYLTETLGGTIGLMSDFISKTAPKTKQSSNSLIKDWLVDWPKTNTIALSTKPSGEVEGYLYFLDLKNGSLEKILEKVTGLTALVNPSNQTLIYSQSTTGGILTYLYDYKNRRASLFSAQTLPEKCVWSKGDSDIIFCAVPSFIESGVYPDQWYQGTTSFEDEIWKINTKTGESEIIVGKKYFGLSGVDATQLSLSETENYIGFVNKKDSSLWTIQLK